MSDSVRFTDRRLNSGGKSTGNQHDFFLRAKSAIKKVMRETTTTANGKIADVLTGEQVIIIPSDGLDEPSFVQGSGGVHNQVFPGNKKFIEGDILPRQGESGGSSQDGGGGEGEDAFRFVLSREAYLDLFLDDLELPDLAKRKLAAIEFEGVQRAGYSQSGNPMSIAILRSMRGKLARKIALQGPIHQEIKRLEQLLRECESEEDRATLKDLLDREQAKLGRIIKFDPIDIRYRRFEKKPKLISQAVMFCLMDVSGSMSEHMKDLAKRFYMLLYIFLTRRYRHVEIVFIRHTDQAEEVDEQTFFHGLATGGTVVSSAFQKMKEIVGKRFRPQDWNIYVAQASDGDNSYGDGEITVELLRESILPIIQYLAYLEVGDEDEHGTRTSNSSLWTAYENMRAGGGLPFAMRKISSREEIFPVFRELFDRRPEARQRQAG
jgi:uncharacterized sporulation protein YeaH/YhbH (DUF444 family)